MDLGYDNCGSNENDMIQKEGIEDQENNKSDKEIFHRKQIKSRRMIRQPGYLEDYL